MTDSISGGLDLSGRDLTSAGLGERLKRYGHWLSQRDVFDLASCGALAALVALALWTFQDYAISNDEGVQHQYGELIIAYYKSGFTDLSLFKLDNLYLYGGLFDVLSLGLSYVLRFAGLLDESPANVGEVIRAIRSSQAWGELPGQITATASDLQDAQGLFCRQTQHQITR